MPGDDWKFLPNSLTDAIDQTQQADNWASDQRAQVAQDWGNAQRNIPTPSDSLTNPLGTQHDVPMPAPEPAAGASGPPPTEQSAGATSPPAPAPAASTTYPAPDAPLPTDFRAGTPAPNAPVTAPLVAPSSSSLPKTTAEISGGSPFQGFDTNANSLVTWAGDQVRGQYGDDAARAVQSVLATEGGLSGARGDHGNSFGPLQFFKGGELANFASYLGVSQDQAGQYAEEHPQEAIQWALNTYLGKTLQDGLKQGLSGAQLATFLQANGQRSQSPERAGQWYNTLFAGGQDPFSQPVTAGQAGASGITGPAQRTSQFSMGLSTADAMAFCGPAAAIAFAQTYGRNPTVAEAKQLATEVGWNPSQGMAGVASEQALLSKMGIQTKLEQTINWDHVASDANNGNPVIIDTPGHYFYVTGARQGANGTEFNVGTSGTDLKTGSVWMTAADMARTMGTPRAALYADHPLANGPSVAEQSKPPDVGQMIGSFAQGVQNTAGNIVQAVQNVGAAAGATQNPLETVFGTPDQPSGLSNALLNNPAEQATRDVTQQLQGHGVLDNLQVAQDLAQKYPMAGSYGTLPDLDAMPPEDRDRYAQAMMGVVAMAAGDVENQGRPLFGRGGVPGGPRDAQGNLTRPGVPAPTQPQDVEEALAQSQLQVVIKQARAQGMSDDQITQVFKNIGASDDQIQTALHPPEQPMQPPPTPPERGGSAGGGTPAPPAAAESPAPPEDAPPPVQFDEYGNEVTPPVAQVPAANPMQNVAPGGVLQPGVQNIPGRQGGAVPTPKKLPSKIISANQPIGPSPEIAQGPSVPARAGITPDTVLTAHQRIDRALGPGDKADAAHEQLDQMLANGAAPDEIARFLGGQVEGKSPDALSVLRTVRTGAMAGGLTTERNVMLSPVIQTAMRAPVGALKAIVTGQPGDIVRGMQGGLAGLAEGAADGLQTLRYGTNYRAALTGGAQGGYGFAPGIDVMGSNVAQRVAGTAALGLVRTHGALSDVSAGIGRGANAALGASPEAAAEAGQQWALRSGDYGTVGKAVSDALEGLRSKNPALNVVGQILVPFYRVGYNVLTQGVERSPLGFAGRVTDALQGKPLNTDKLLNNFFGVGLATLGLAQAANGNITGERPENGAPKWSVQVGGQWMPLRSLGPAGEALAQSAALYEAARDNNGDVPKMAEQVASEYVNHIYDETWLRSIGDAIGTVSDVGNLASPNKSSASQATRDLQYQGGSYAKSVVPQSALIGQVAKAAGEPDIGSRFLQLAGAGAGAGPSRTQRPTAPTTRSSRPARPSR